MAQCKTCKFYIGAEAVKGSGYCHRWPPTRNTASAEGLSGKKPSVRPVVSESDWCGEHAAKK